MQPLSLHILYGALYLGTITQSLSFNGQPLVQQVLDQSSPIKDLGDEPFTTLDVKISSCSDDKIPLITTEFERAVRMASISSKRFTAENPYVKSFWPNAGGFEKFYFQPAQIAYGGAYLAHMAGMAEKGRLVAPVDLFVTCKPGGLCESDAGAGTKVSAYTNSNTNTINLCPAWFEMPDSDQVPCEDGKVLSRYDSKARAVVHELAHLQLTPRFEDYFTAATDVEDRTAPKPTFAYGVAACVSLAANQWGVGKPVPAAQAANNADNFAWIATGTTWQALCATQTKNPAFKLPVG